MEKFKDVIHDYTDILLAVIIAIAMFLVVNWNLGSWLPSNNVVLAENSPVQYEEDVDQTKKDEEEIPKDDVEESVIEQEQVEEEKEVPEQPATPSDNEIIVVNDISITIPAGSTGSAIGNILKDNGLIDDVNAFISEAERLNLLSRLQSGTFTIPTNASMELMVKIISNQVR